MFIKLILSDRYPPDMSDKPSIKRALELASDGKHRSVAEIKMTLLEEGYQDAHSDVSEPSIIARLRDNIKAARSEKRPAS